MRVAEKTAAYIALDIGNGVMGGAFSEQNPP